jgi:hypothetical protein
MGDPNFWKYLKFGKVFLFMLSALMLRLSSVFPRSKWLSVVQNVFYIHKISWNRFIVYYGWSLN